MNTLALSTIAQLLFAEPTTLDFARIVGELDAVLSRLRDGDVVITWDCDDLVTFDMAETRIVLAWTEIESHRLGGCLTVTVGPCPAAATRPERTEHDVLCSRLVERVQSRFNPAAVLWCQVAGPVDAEVVDDLMDALPDLASGLPPVDSILDGLSRADLHRATEQVAERLIRAVTVAPVSDAAPVRLAPAPHIQPAPGSDIVANDHPDLPQLHSAELARLRQALYPPMEQTPEITYSTQMRLAAHCMNATLILVWAPLGAAVMTYSVLKGENMALSSRLMAVSGTLFALAHSPVGQTVSAMAKSIG